MQKTFPRQNKHKATKPWLSCLLRHPARKHSAPILITPEPGTRS